MFDRPVSQAWFPEPPCAFLEIGNNITVRVHRGAAAYQLSSGEVVKL